MNIKNFTTDWNDGKALSSLVDSCAPGLIPDWDELQPCDALENTRTAMNLARDWLDIPQIVTPEELVNKNIDELSVMTYVSYFPEAKLKEGAPLRVKENLASKCRIVGLENTQLQKNVETKVEIHSLVPLNVSHLDIRVYGPNRKNVDVKVEEQNDKLFYFYFTPLKNGQFFTELILYTP